VRVNRSAVAVDTKHKFTMQNQFQPRKQRRCCCTWLNEKLLKRGNGAVPVQNGCWAATHANCFISINPQFATLTYAD